MLGFGRFRWRTVTGGSRTYVERLQRLGPQLHLGLGVRSLRRTGRASILRLADGSLRRSTTSCRDPRRPGSPLLEDPSDDERRVLGGFDYSTNDAVLHTDSVVPAARRARAGGVELPAGRRRTRDRDVPPQPAAGPRAERDYCVTLNEHVADEHVIARFTYEHPLYTVSTLQAQRELPRAVRAAAHVVRGRALRQRLPRGRPRLGRRGGRGRSAWPGEVGAVRGDADARAPRAGANVFRYPVSYFLVDLDELPTLERRLRLFSGNRRTRDAARRATTSTAAAVKTGCSSSPATARSSGC